MNDLSRPMAYSSEVMLPSYEVACVEMDAPPPYYIHNVKTMGLHQNSELCQEQIGRDINTLPYSKLEYPERDLASVAPDIYFDEKFVSKIADENSDDMMVKSDKDGRTYCYSLMKISNEHTLMHRFLSVLSYRSKSAYAKANRCQFINLETHVVFRYMLTTTCRDKAPGLTRRVGFVDFEDYLFPEELLLSAKAKTVFHETGSSLSTIPANSLCHETIRRKSRKFLQYHETIIPKKLCRFRHQVQTVDIFPLQVVHCKYKGRDFKFFALGELGTLYFPSEYSRTISILKPLFQSRYI